MSAQQAVHVPGISEGLIEKKVPISPAVKANGFVKGDISVQTRQCLETVKHVLAAAGSSLDKVVSVRVYITNAAYFGTVNEIYKGYFAQNPPTRTFINVGSWPLEFDIEIECVALA